MKLGFLLVIIGILMYHSNGLRCRTDEGISKDDFRKTSRTCMRRLTSDDGENYDEYENYDTNESNSSEFGYRSQSKNNNNNKNNNRGRHKSENESNRRNQNRHGNHQGNDNGYNRDNNHNNNQRNSWNGDLSRRFKRQMSYPYAGMGMSQVYSPFGNSPYDFNSNTRNQYPNNGYDWYQGSESTSNYNNNNNNGRSSNGNGYNSNDNQSNKSCLMQCFFEEMKMTSNEGYPDRHKVLHVITEEIRDRELKEFYTDSIQECFHVLDLGNRGDKCEYSKNLVTCLSERAKINCDDWNGNSSILFN
uniref:CSON001186 protein n=1 Tax=Culicoides sonorensis TaxID=179676 RepID=A0A336K825_CULSO